MTYQSLGLDTVLRYVLDQPDLRGTFPGPAGVEVREIGDGNLNLVFVLEDGDGHGLIVKQALPYLRVAGESWPLTRDRMRFETQALQVYGEQIPGAVPKVHHANEAMSLVAMEYLRDHRVLRGVLTEGAQPPTLADAIGNFMATTHFMNSDLCLTGEEKKARQTIFTNPHLCRLQEDFVFTNPFMDSPENDASGLPASVVEALRSDAVLKTAIVRTKVHYLTHAQTLLHGDLHTGSIMVAGDDVRVIDPEFAFYGPAAYDLGTFLAHLAIDALAAPAHARDRGDALSRQRYAVDTMRDTWSCYRRVTHDLWADGHGRGIVPARFWSDLPNAREVQKAWLDGYLDAIVADAVRHAGCEVLRRLMGIVTTSDLATIDDLETRQSTETSLADVARTWLVTAPTDAAASPIDTMIDTLGTHLLTVEGL